ncbi:EI24 domain-containing protein [Tsuneonella sp. HG222]
MTLLPTSLARGFGALGERAVLRVLAKTVLATLAVFAVLGTGGYFALEAGLERLGLGDTGAGALVAVLLVVVASWLLFRLVALAVLQLFADEVVVAVERRSYPRAAEEARKLPLSEDVRNALGGAARAVIANLVALPFALVLLFTGVGPALVFWAVNAWLLGRELVDMVWQRHRPSRDVAAPVPRLEQFLLGGAIVALLAVPLVNFLAPVLGAAAATHLVHGRRRLAHA